jgi:outer membrane protein OmpA-like peptidoglycan-associated protein
MNPKTYLAALACASAFGCAHTVPSELVNARAAYTRAAYGPTGKDAPTELSDAAKALSRANAEYEEHPKSDDVKDLAYIAERKVERAESRARTRQLERTQVEAKKRLSLAQANAAARAGGAMTETQRRLEEEQRQRQAQEARLTQAEQQLQEEREARERAEQQARETAERLEKIGTVKQEARGTVLTLSGSLLFASGRSDLLPEAQQKLSEVADALKASPQQPIEVDGHTDSQGPDAYNLQLSNLRAETVRRYLISQGVEPNRVRSFGFGESRPVSDNGSAEGRAYNRRVEIVLEKVRGDQGLGGSGQQ